MNNKRIFTPLLLLLTITICIISTHTLETSSSPQRLAKRSEILRESRWPQELGSSYSIGNHGMAGEVTAKGRLFGDIQLNPPHPGTELESVGEGSFSVHHKQTGQTVHDYEMDQHQDTRVFPEYMAIFNDDRMSDAWMAVRAYSPIDSRSSFNGFIPALVIDIVVSRSPDQTTRDYKSLMDLHQRMHTETQNMDITVNGTIVDRKQPVQHNQDSESAQQFQLAYDFAIEQFNSDHKDRFHGIKQQSSPSQSDANEFAARLSQHNAQVVQQDQFFLLGIGGNGQAGITQANMLSMKVNVTLEPGQQRLVSFVLGHFDSNGFYAEKLPSQQSLIEHLVHNRHAMSTAHSDFVELLPKIGDAQVDEYLRWYMSAGLMLTKGLRDGTVYTMGHISYQQTDSFWSTWMHLFWWPDLDRTMIELSAGHQLPSGKIPSTLFPQTDRADDIEPTQYFILRAIRHLEWHRDQEFANKLWPAVRGAVEYLASLDSGDGIPEQKTVYADWKSVPFVKGRRYSPNFALLQLAVLKQVTWMAKFLNRSQQTVDKFQQMFAKASGFINGDATQGQGMWNGTHYVDIWHKDSAPTQDYVEQDQQIGLFWNVIPENRVDLVLDSLLASENRCGVRSTYPYNPKWPKPGCQHNGGIWPWMNLLEVSNRMQHHRVSDGMRLMRKLGQYALRSTQSFHPAEYLHGESCRSHAHPIQTWDTDAVAVATVLRGMYGLKRLDQSRFALSVHVQQLLQADNDHFETFLPLPNGLIHLKICHGAADAISGHDHQETFLELNLIPQQPDVSIRVTFDRSPLCSTKCHLLDQSNIDDTHHIQCAMCDQQQTKLGKRKPFVVEMDGGEAHFIQI